MLLAFSNNQHKAMVGLGVGHEIINIILMIGVSVILLQIITESNQTQDKTTKIPEILYPKNSEELTDKSEIQMESITNKS